MILAKYFKDTEFLKCTPACSLQNMNQDAIDCLDKMREVANTPIILNSAYRSPEWEKSRGRSGTGAHTLGLAFDLKCKTDDIRFKLISAAVLVGCKRIGIAKTYIHVDFSQNHTQSITWLY